MWIVYRGVRYTFPSVEALHYAGLDLSDAILLRPWPRLVASWLITAVVGGIVAGVIVELIFAN